MRFFFVWLISYLFLGAFLLFFLGNAIFYWGLNFPFWQIQNAKKNAKNKKLIFFSISFRFCILYLDWFCVYSNWHWHEVTLSNDTSSKRPCNHFVKSLNSSSKISLLKVKIHKDDQKSKKPIVVFLIRLG
jgi:hypothetical protein